MNNHHIFSSCICASRSTFQHKISFKSGAFKGALIGECMHCKMYKTIKFPLHFDSKTSRATLYEDKSRILRSEFQPLLRSLNTILPKKGRVLDVGTSSGIFATLCLENGFDVWSLEPNKTAYAIGKKKKMKHYLNDDLLTFHKKHPTVVFDAIVYNHVLEHIPNLNQEILFIKKSLKKNGYLCIGVPNRRNVVFFLRRGFWESLMPKEHVWHFTDEYLMQFLKNNGFVICDVFYANHNRADLSLFKRVYFKMLTMLNTIFKTGEAVTVIAKMR